jgi:LacI family transcriptional regulator
MKRPTQQDVAQLAGVSRASVSYVLNGVAKQTVHISEETRGKIIQAAHQLGYEPDAAAQSLRSQKSRTIGVLIPDMFNPHYWEIVRGVESSLLAEKYDLMLMSTSLSPEREYSALRTLLRRRVDGLILALSYFDQEQREVQTFIRRSSPVVLLGSHLEALDSVNPDDLIGGAALYQHLLELGHRQVGLVHGVANAQMGASRIIMYRQFIAENNPQLGDTLLETCGVSIQDGFLAAQNLLERSPRPTAIVVINDLLAMGVMHAVSQAGLRVPEDVSVAGYDDIYPAGYLNPALTTVKMHADEMGRSAARLLFERMAKSDSPPQHINIPTQLIRRASTGPAPAQTG